MTYQYFGFFVDASTTLKEPKPALKTSSRFDLKLKNGTVIAIP